MPAQNSINRCMLNQLNCPPDIKISVPHATYSVRYLVRPGSAHNIKNVSTSIHHQETEAENQFIATRTEHWSRFSGVWIESGSIYSNRKNCIQRADQRYMSADQNTLLVHKYDEHTCGYRSYRTMERSGLFWVTCPNANLYIENKMPHYQYWLDRKSKVCIGTDSLASNWHFICTGRNKTIQRYQSYVPPWKN